MKKKDGWFFSRNILEEINEVSSNEMKEKNRQIKTKGLHKPKKEDSKKTIEEQLTYFKQKTKKLNREKKQLQVEKRQLEEQVSFYKNQEKKIR